MIMQPALVAMFDSDIARVLLRRINLFFFIFLAGCSSADKSETALQVEIPQYSGSEACGACHETQFSRWENSHHAQAMQHASVDSVRGDFSDAEFQHFNTTSKFYQRDDEFFVLTDNAEGNLQEFQIAYTFGVEPLQQYLIEFTDGRMQALPLAWDSRSDADGGQKWFHLYPNEPIVSEDPLHWTGREHNWNFMCAECHSTNLVKNYAADADSYASTWSEISVGCEACHGPASNHVNQAASGEFNNRFGLVLDLDDAGRATWEMNLETGIAARTEFRTQIPKQPEACGRCHSRRAVSAADYQFGRPLLDTHTPVLLDEGLYFADGQVHDEVYVYGSFIQSRMYQAGVSCSNCHDPHSGELHTGPDPNSVCAGCHLPTRFAATEHHRHAAESIACVDCHMPARDYMVIDSRRDHSFRVPRPDLTEATGSPNACNQCHDDEDPAWAVAALNRWYGASDRPHFGLALHAASSGSPDANIELLTAINDPGTPPIAKATALSVLRPPLSQGAANTIQEALSYGDPLVRIGALRALSGLQPDAQAELAGPLLSDSILSVRIEAARILSPLRSVMPVRFVSPFSTAEIEMIAALDESAERPESRAYFASLRIDAGDIVGAEQEFAQALSMEPNFMTARINFADMYRQAGRDSDAEEVLREGLALTPDAAALRHSLGLVLVRIGRQDDGLLELRRAMELNQVNPRYSFVYAIALNSLGQSQAATEFLFSIKDQFLYDFDIHWALATMLRDQGRFNAARDVASDLVERFPDASQVTSLLDSLP